MVTHYDIGWYHNDHLGTPLAITDSAKTVRWSAQYYPFGSLASENVSILNILRFPGQYHDRTTDLYYNMFRHYRPDLGRYMTPDPIGLAGGTNLYGYAGQNPINYVDRYGLYSWGEFGRDVWSAYQTGMDILFPTSWVAGRLNDYVVSLIPEKVRKGTFFLTGFGEEAVDFWAEKYNQASADNCDNWYPSPAQLGYGAMGWAASWWTEENWDKTTTVLVGAWGLRRAGQFWYMKGDQSRAYTLIDYKQLFRLEWHKIGRGAMNAPRWHVDAPWFGIRHWPWGF